MTDIITKINTNHLEKKIFWFLSMSIVAAVVFYGFLVNQTVINIVERENIQDQTTMLNSEISGLEFNYIALKNEINLEYAYSVGFENTKNIEFASRRLSEKALTLRNQ
jgi:hypothetical protein